MCRYNENEQSDKQLNRYSNDWNNYMTDFDSCYAMREGKLVLRGIVNQVQPNDTAPYLTGGVYTKVT